jgi:hypothetical protein
MDGKEKRLEVKEVELFFIYFTNVRAVYNL